MQLDVCFYHVAYAFRVNVHSVTAWISRNSWLELGVISVSYVAKTGLEPPTPYFQNKQSII